MIEKPEIDPYSLIESWIPYSEDNLLTVAADLQSSAKDNEKSLKGSRAAVEEYLAIAPEELYESHKNMYLEVHQKWEDNTACEHILVTMLERTAAGITQLKTDIINKFTETQAQIEKHYKQAKNWDEEATTANSKEAAAKLRSQAKTERDKAELLIQKSREYFKAQVLSVEDLIAKIDAEEEVRLKQYPHWDEEEITAEDIAEYTY